MNDCPEKQEILNTPLEDWIDGVELQRVLHISPRTVFSLREKHTIGYSRINKKIYFRRQDIQKILADNYVMSTIEINENFLKLK